MRLPGATPSPLGLLRVLLVSTLVVPALLFAAAAWLNWHAALADAATDLLRTSEVSREHAAKIFDGQSQVADRVSDLVQGLDAPSIAASEKTLHDAFNAIIARLPQVQTVLLTDAAGHPLVSAGTYPVPRALSLRGRDYVDAVLDRHESVFVSKLQVGDINRQLFFGLAHPWRGEGGVTQGVINVAVSPVFFQEFYAALIAESGEEAAGKVITLVRADGQILVRYPPLSAAPPAAPAGSPFLAALQADPERGSYVGRSIVDAGAPARIYAYRRVQGYPVYVVAGRARDDVTAGWRRTMASHLIFGIPASLALFAITWTAIGRTRREADALDRARREIVRREAAEATLLQAQRLEAVGQMTGGVAHDFNNLLTVILGSAEMLEKRPDDPARVRRLAAQIELAARRGGEVTQKLLAFSRRQHVNPETLDLNRCLLEFKPLLDRAALEAIRIDLDLGTALAPVLLDPGHFEAAILNLVGNARDAMPGGGRIVISTGNVTLPPDGPAAPPQGAYVRVAVADTGSGMDAATAARAIEPFFTTKDVGRGTGLGLSQVYGFAKQAGGDMRIHTAPGEGTTVELLLPRTEGRVADPAAAGPGADARALAGEVVLVVEDEAAVLDMTAQGLRDLGYEVLTASTAREALAVLQTAGRVDALFSDVMMPGGMDGVQLALAARRQRPGLKVLLTSGYTTNQDSGLQGDHALLTKPYDGGQLAAQLRAVLKADASGPPPLQAATGTAISPR